MPDTMTKIARIALVTTLIFFFTVQTIKLIFAQTYSVAQYQIIDDDVQNGQIISLVGKSYQLAKSPYDENIFGVVNISAALTLDTIGADNAYPVSLTGHVYVLVNDSNGSIEAADSITSSPTAGIGMKATEPGMVIGQALEGLPPDITEGETLVALNPHFAGLVTREPTDAERLLAFLSGLFKFVDPSQYEEPTLAFKYVLSSLVLLLSLVFGFLSFTRLARTGIEAIGRNPLAGRLITVGIGLNVVITVVIIGAGFMIAYYILVL